MISMHVQLHRVCLDTSGTCINWDEYSIIQDVNAVAKAVNIILIMYCMFQTLTQGVIFA